VPIRPEIMVIAFGNCAVTDMRCSRASPHTPCPATL
jgi:hypothetical protein